MRALRNGSTDTQLSKLWRGDFFRLAAVPLLRVKAGHNCVPIVFRHDVHRQQALSALWRRGCAGERRGSAGVKVPAMPC